MVVGALRRLPHPLVEPLRIVADKDTPLAGLDAVEDDFGGLRARSLAVFWMSASDIFEVSMFMPCKRCRVARRSFGVSAALPFWITRELATIEVPIWPGITTEHLMCGALRRRSLISASVKPFTANLAAE